MSTAAMMRRLAQTNPLPPDVDGMGYKTSRIQGGAGFSYTRYATKAMPNGVFVQLRESVPSPFENKAIKSEYSVWIGQSCQGEELACPFYAPAGITCWAPDGEVNWFAVFGDDGASAEAFALALKDPPAYAPGYQLAVSEADLSRYFRDEFLTNASKWLREQRNTPATATTTV